MNIKKTITILISFIILTGSWTIIIFYGNSFGYIQSLSWLAAFAIAFAMKLFIIEPIKVGICCLISVFNRRRPPPDRIFDRKFLTGKKLSSVVLAQNIYSLLETWDTERYKRKCDEQFRRKQIAFERTLISYARILSEISMFALYMLTIMLLPISSKDPLDYYSTKYIEDIFHNSTLDVVVEGVGLEQQMIIQFVEKNITNTFISLASMNNETTQGPPVKILGVVRMRQLRASPCPRDNHSTCKNLSSLNNFDQTMNFNPHWRKEEPLVFEDIYRHIIDPWKYRKSFPGLPIFGKLNIYPNGVGYMINFARNLDGTRKILKFIRNSHWIDKLTTVIFIEFTAYNPVTNIFNTVIILFERNIVGKFEISLQTKSMKSSFVPGEFSYTQVILFAVNVILNIILLYRIFKDLLFRKEESASIMWNIIDILLVILCIISVVLFFLREEYVSELSRQLEQMKHNEIVHLHFAMFYEDLLTWLHGFLICLVTLRIYKVLQFSSTFNVLTNTMSTTINSLASTAFFMMIFIVGGGICCYLIAGYHVASLRNFSRTLTSLMAFSIGFASGLHAHDFTYRGYILGALIYGTLMIAVRLFFLNIMITSLCFHTTTVRMEIRKMDEGKYSFWRYIKDEIRENLFPFKANTKNTLSFRPNFADAIVKEAICDGSKLRSKHRKYYFLNDKARLVNEIVRLQYCYLHSYMEENSQTDKV